ncbi:MAG: hypothetical protein IMZ44_07320 [Planctomycetes bacterium]|nr:hypothetical protein [Planctomycetota bacterium]
MSGRFWLPLALVAAAWCHAGAAQAAPAGAAQAAPAGAAQAAPAVAFAADCAATAAEAEKAGALSVAGQEGWLFLTAELRHLGVGPFWGERAAKVSRAATPGHADPLPAILDFKQQLDKAGIELLLVPVPAKAVIYPDMLFARPGAAAARDAVLPRLDAADGEFYDVLRKAGVNVLDLTPAFLADRSSIQGPLFCRQDSHWSGNGCVVAAGQIAQAIKGRPWLKERQRMRLAAEPHAVEITGDLAPDAGTSKAPPEKVPLRLVGTRASGRLEPLPDDRASPIVLLGDSSNLVFHSGGDLYAAGAGLADQLALELGLALDVVAVRGSGATAARINLARRALADPDYLKAKRLVLWCFAAREFTEADGWRLLPLAHPAPAAK